MPRLQVRAIRRRAGRANAMLDDLTRDRPLGKIAHGSASLHRRVKFLRPHNQLIVAVIGGLRRWDKPRPIHTNNWRCDAHCRFVRIMCVVIGKESSEFSRASKQLLTQMKVRVAIIQEAPIWMHLQASLKKLARLVKAAAKKGARLVVVGETWLPGYPAWLDYYPSAALWDHAPTKAVFARLRQNSVAVPRNQTKFLARLAAALKVTLVIRRRSGELNDYNTAKTLRRAR
jgi:Carbon-nitrogen hydrolase